MSTYDWRSTINDWPHVWTVPVTVETPKHRGRWRWFCKLREPRDKEPALIEVI